MILVSGQCKTTVPRVFFWQKLFFNNARLKYTDLWAHRPDYLIFISSDQKLFCKPTAMWSRGLYFFIPTSRDSIEE